jgi:hypothetical protein
MAGQQVEHVRRRVRRLREFYMHAAVFAVVIGGLALMNWLTTPTFWWVVFPAIAWAIGLGAHAVAVIFEDSLLGVEWEERKTREFVDRERGGTG